MTLSLKSDTQVLQELGELLEKHRIARQLQDKDIIEKGGVSKDALNNFKRGRSITMANFIKIMRGMGLLDTLPSLFPHAYEPLVSLKPKQERKRIVKKAVKAKSKPVNWSQ